MIQKKRVIGIICSIALTACMTGCVEGDAQNEIKSGTVKYDVFLNSGSCFVYTFQDPVTGVWYISTAEGVTERFNPDGSLYVK